jgi:TolA-binding protein
VMTTINALPSFTTPRRSPASDSTASNAAFGSYMDQQAARTEPSHAERISDLQEQLDALEKRQLRMSINDYLTAKFTLQDQMTTERLEAGEDLETMGIRFNDHVFTIAAKRLDPDLLKSVQLPDEVMARLSKPKGSTVF